jgi:hypothetical protein
VGRAVPPAVRLIDTIVSGSADPLWARANQVDAAAASLLRLAGRVDSSAGGKPLLLGVSVGSGYGLVRADGVAVVPIGVPGR